MKSIRVYQKPEYKVLREMNFSKDELLFYDILKGLNDCSHYELEYYPNAFPDVNGDEDVYSYIRVILFNNYKIDIYFKSGDYDSWIFSDIIQNTRSRDKDKNNIQKATEKIGYIIEQYKSYEETAYNISKHTDDIYY